MFEIILLIAATSGIVALARARGGKPWLWGTLTVVGYFLVPFLVTFFAVALGATPKGVKENAQVWFYVSAVTWVAVLARPRIRQARRHVVLSELQISESAVRCHL